MGKLYAIGVSIFTVLIIFTFKEMNEKHSVFNTLYFVGSLITLSSFIYARKNNIKVFFAEPQ